MDNFFIWAKEVVGIGSREMKLFYEAKKITHIAKPFYHYRTNPNSLSNSFSNNKKALEDFAEFSKAVRNFLLQRVQFGMIDMEHCFIHKSHAGLLIWCYLSCGRSS